MPGGKGCGLRAVVLAQGLGYRMGDIRKSSGWLFKMVLSGVCGHGLGGTYETGDIYCAFFRVFEGRHMA